MRERLRQLAAEAGAARPEALADALHLLMDGAYMAARLYNGAAGNPTTHLAGAAEQLIDAHCGRP